MVPLAGFLPPDDRRGRGTVEGIERGLTVDGLVLRYRSHAVADGLPPGEGAYLACSFWLCDALALIGRREDALARFENLLESCNDVGRLAEEYDPHGRHQHGNLHHAFSTMPLLNTPPTQNHPPQTHPNNRKDET